MSDDLRGTQDTNEQERPLSEIIDGLVARHGFDAVLSALDKNRSSNPAQPLPDTVSPEDMKTAAQGGQYPSNG